MNIHLDNLEIGEWRNLTEKELTELKNSLGASLNMSEKQRGN
jgi:16S rRNA U516 pseudouridylate synthase RsuA-like enzyme